MYMRDYYASCGCGKRQHTIFPPPTPPKKSPKITLPLNTVRSNCREEFYQPLLFMGCINMAPYVLKVWLLYSFGPSFFQTQPAIVNIPQNANASGIFGNLTQSLNITWLNNDNVTNQFIIRFEKNDTTNRYMITNITMSVTPTEDEFPGFKGKLKGYLCMYLYLFLWYCQYLGVYSVCRMVGECWIGSGCGLIKLPPGLWLEWLRQTHKHVGLAVVINSLAWRLTPRTFWLQVLENWQFLCYFSCMQRNVNGHCE